MGALVGTAQVLRRDLRVALGRGDGGVAQELLDDPHVGAAAQHVGGTRVAQDVRADPVGQADAAGVLLDHAEDPHTGQPPPTDVEEHRLGIAAAAPLLRLEQGRPSPESHSARAARASRPIGTTRSLFPLPSTRSSGQIGALHRGDDVAQVQAHQLADAGARPVEDLEHRPIAQDRGPGPDDGTEQQLRLLLAQRLRQQVGDGDRRQVERGIVAAQPFFDEEAVEAADARERPGHRRGVVGPAQQLQVGRHLGGVASSMLRPPRPSWYAARSRR